MIRAKKKLSERIVHHVEDRDGGKRYTLKAPDNYYERGLRSMSLLAFVGINDIDHTDHRRILLELLQEEFKSSKN